VRISDLLDDVLLEESDGPRAFVLAGLFVLVVGGLMVGWHGVHAWSQYLVSVHR
jgi:hypothetical protein